MDVLLAVVTTVVGAILGLIVSRWDSWRQTASRGDLRGEWLSVSHGGDHSVVHDRVRILRRWGKLYLKNVGNEFGYSYDAFAGIECQNILTGTWRSLRSGSSARGHLVLIVNPQATQMLGVYTGKTVEGQDVILGWILARTEVDLAPAMARGDKIFDFAKIGTTCAEQGNAADGATRRS